jgi:excisionase family DNA binding protein
VSEAFFEASGRDDRDDPAGRPVVAPMLLTIPEAARVLSVGRTTMYALIDAGAIEVVHIGRCIRVPIEAIRLFVEERRAESRGATVPVRVERLVALRPSDRSRSGRR